MAANDGLNRSPVEVLRTRSNDGTDPFFGKPLTKKKKQLFNMLAMGCDG